MLRGGCSGHHINSADPTPRGLAGEGYLPVSYDKTMVGFAHFDATGPLRDALCISTFLVSMTDEGLLLGRMKEHERWKTLDIVASGALAFEEDRWVLPASHLRIGEDPSSAAERIAFEQLGASYEDLSLWRILSFAYPFPPRNQDLHWDLCFVYGVEVEMDAVPPWFEEVRRIPPGDLGGLRYARGHGDVVQELGLATW